MNHLWPDQAPYTVCNSSLSEYGVLGGWGLTGMPQGLGGQAASETGKEVRGTRMVLRDCGWTVSSQRHLGYEIMSHMVHQASQLGERDICLVFFSFCLLGFFFLFVCLGLLVQDKVCFSV
jgi:hypothetical protein